MQSIDDMFTELETYYLTETLEVVDNIASSLFEFLMRKVQSHQLLKDDTQQIISEIREIFQNFRQNASSSFDESDENVDSHTP